MKYKIYFKANDLENDEELQTYINKLKELQKILRSDIVILDENKKVVYEVEVKKWKLKKK